MVLRSDLFENIGYYDFYKYYSFRIRDFALTEKKYFTNHKINKKYLENLRQNLNFLLYTVEEVKKNPKNFTFEPRVFDLGVVEHSHFLVKLMWNLYNTEYLNIPLRFIKSIPKFRNSFFLPKDSDVFLSVNENKNPVVIGIRIIKRTEIIKPEDYEFGLIKVEFDDSADFPTDPISYLETLYSTMEKLYKETEKILASYSFYLNSPPEKIGSYTLELFRKKLLEAL